MTPPILYATERGGCPLPVEVHATQYVEAIRRAITMPGRATREASVAEALAPMLRAAYEAGVREGESRALASLETVMRDRVRAAVSSIVVTPARCPHCDGGRTASGPCSVCGGTGNRK